MNEERAARLTALFLPGPDALRVTPLALSLLRQDTEREEFHRRGLRAEAERLSDQGALRRAQRLIREGRVFTAFHDAWPIRWPLTTPVLWRAGDLPPAPWVGGVGSREISASVADWCAEVGAHIDVLVSGGAVGCDSAFQRSAKRTLILLPCGLNRTDHRASDRVTLLSPFAPDEGFSRGAAMARNRLIYAGAEVTVVGAARYRKGGTWHGARDALKRGDRLLVRPDPDDPALSGLRALGAESLTAPERTPEALTAPAPLRLAL